MWSPPKADGCSPGPIHPRSKLRSSLGPLKDPQRGGVYPDAWHIPGGGVEVGESLELAARRESLEEVGIDLTSENLAQLPFVGHGETTKTLPSGEQIWVKMTFNRFEARLSKPAAEIILNPMDDLVVLQWFDKSELATLPLVPGGREFFEQAGYLEPSL